MVEGLAMDEHSNLLFRGISNEEKIVLNWLMFLIFLLLLNK
jgi:hypothetical protein